MEEQNNKPKLVIDLRQLVDGIDNNISENTGIQNEIWQGVLKLVITLSSSMLVLSIAFVDKVFVTIPIYIVISWLFFFVSIIFGIIALVNETVEFSNFVHNQSKKKEIYVRMIEEGKNEMPYEPELHSDLIKYNDIIWGVITLDSFFFAVTFILCALLDKVSLFDKDSSLKFCMGSLIVSTIFIASINIYFLKKRKTK